MNHLAQKATPKRARTRNSRLVLKTIYDCGQISRADIARATRLTRPTVSDVVADLMEKGLVRQVIHGVGRSLGIAAANLVGVLGSCRILIAGSVTCFGQFLLDTIQEEMYRRSLLALARNTEIGIVSLGPDIVLLGASALLLPHELGLL
jgi:predicted NBD/HSP70 family sugar kinase